MISLYILTKATEKIGLAVADQKIRELVIDRPEAPQLIGSIFLGKVVKVDKGLQAAFVDIGSDKHAYLERKELPEARRDPKKRMESLITEGQSLIVQVMKDAYDHKGARLTANITLPSQSLVYLPRGQYFAASRKIPEQLAKERKENLRQISQEEEGAIIRTSALQESDEQLENTYIRLRKWWYSLMEKSKHCTAPSCIWKDDAVTDRFIRSFSPEQLTEINFEDVATLNDVKDRFPELEPKMQWDKTIINQLPKSIDQLYQEILDPIVIGKHGITLSIEHTEALTVIDVNSAGYSSKRVHGNTPLQVNLAAIPAITDQVRLRNISGMILIDFLKMKNTDDQKKVLQKLNKEMLSDRVRTEVYGFTKLGLVEVTRKREAPLHSSLIRDATQKRSLSLSKESQLYQLERLILSYQQMNTESIIIEVNPALYRLWREKINVKHLRQFVKQNIYFVSSKGVAHFNEKLVGSEQLIADYLAGNPKQVIDKVI